jgi:hypothetical protein
MEKLAKYGGLVFAIIALVVSLVAVGYVRDEAQGLHPGPNFEAAALTVGSDGGGYDVTYYSDTSGDLFLWDSSAEGLTITGTAAQAALTIADGNVSVDDDLDVNGATSLDAVTTGVAGTGNDVQLFSDTSGDHFLWDASEEGLYITGTDAQDALDIVDGNVDIEDDVDVNGTTNLDDVDIDLSASLNIDGHMVDIGTGSYTTADGDNDLGVAADLEVDGATDLDGTLAVAGATTLAADISTSNVPGSAEAIVEFVGVPKITAVSFGTGTDGTATVAGFDASPMGECAEVDAGTNVAITADTSIYRHTTNSIKLAITTNADNDGWDCTIAQTDFSGHESVGFWIYATETITSGDIDLTLDDTDGTDQVYNIGAVTANTWTWKELDISGCDANCNTTDGIHFLETAQAAAYQSFDLDIYVDGMYIWDADEEEALGVAALNDGVVGIFAVVTATGGNRTPVTLAEYTSYFIHYESGNDFVVWMDDQSSNSLWGLVATE